MVHGPLATLLLLLPIAALTACSTDADCHLNGACLANACECLPGWKDDSCGSLNLAPMDPNNGYNHLFEGDGNISTSWGGRALLGDDGLYHFFFSWMMNHCTIRNYSTNSVCAHGVGTSALGPFTMTDILMAPECHNTLPMRGPAGEWLIWHIGSGNRNPVKCPAGGNDEYQAPNSAPQMELLGAPGGYSDIGILVSSSPYGPWTRVTDLLRNGVDGEWDSGGVTNPAPMLLPNGSVLLAFRGRNATGGERLGIAFSASGWKGPYTKLLNRPITTVNSEDPFLWSDSNDNLHILYHAFDEGGHCFAPKDDPTNWTTQPYPAYNRTVHWINGTSRIVPRRERPQLFLSGSTPQVLYSGVVVAGTSVAGPAFTSAQAVLSA